MRFHLFPIKRSSGIFDINSLGLGVYALPTNIKCSKHSKNNDNTLFGTLFSNTFSQLFAVQLCAITWKWKVVMCSLHFPQRGECIYQCETTSFSSYVVIYNIQAFRFFQVFLVLRLMILTRSNGN